MKIKEAITKYYNDELNDLNAELKKHSKDDLVEFIEDMQDRGCFGRGIVHE